MGWIGRKALVHQPRNGTGSLVKRGPENFAVQEASHVSFVRKGDVAADRAEEDRAQCPDIRSSIDRLGRGLLRRHVRELSFDDADLGFCCEAAPGFGNSEVDDLGMPGVGHENVVRRNVAVHELE